MSKFTKMGTAQLLKKLEGEITEADAKEIQSLIADRTLKKIMGKRVRFIPFRQEQELEGTVVWSHIYKRDKTRYVIVRVGTKKYYKRIEAVEVIE